MTNKQQEMIEYTIQEVVRYLIEDESVSMEQAMERFYMSGVFDKLNDIETGLYLDGRICLYIRDVKKGKRSFWWNSFLKMARRN